MSERQKETKFLKTLILCDDSVHGRQLQERIKSAERDERCIRGAVSVVVVLALIALSGLGYSAVFAPQSVQFSSFLGTRVCCAFGLGSLISVAVFLGYWFWYRAVSNRVYEECRRFLREALESRLQQPAVKTPVEPSICGLPMSKTEAPQSQQRTSEPLCQ